VDANVGWRVGDLLGRWADDVERPIGTRTGQPQDLVDAVPRRPRRADEDETRSVVARGRQRLVPRQVHAVRYHHRRNVDGPDRGVSSDLGGDDDDAARAPQERAACRASPSVTQGRSHSQLAEVERVELDDRRDAASEPHHRRRDGAVPQVDHVRPPSGELNRESLADREPPGKPEPR
jgi:hypothetical protein